MSEPKLISPLLDNFIVGDPFCSRSGISCCPALDKETDDKYIVKIISTPASPSQMDAMILSGAFSDAEGALQYFNELAKGIEHEVDILEKLSHLEGFLPITGCQTIETENASGFETYLLSPYRKTLDRHMRKEQLTHLSAMNLGLDMCSALATCRRSGYLYASLKPENIIITDEGTYKIGDIGFIPLNSLLYTSLPDRCRSQYTAPEITDAFASLNTTIDVYALGLILYRIFNGGNLPVVDGQQPLPSPDFADYEMSEIILKACAVDPSERWQDPVEFGQALVAYMQRNGVHDTPIIPPTVEAANENTDNSVMSEPETDDKTTCTEDLPETPNEVNVSQEENPVYSEDSSGNLTFLSDDEMLSDEELDQIEYDTVSLEASEILSQADELISHETPSPVVPPEPIDVPIPEPLVQDDIEESPQHEEDVVSEEADTAINEDSASEAVITENVDADTADGGSDSDASTPAKKCHWLRNTLLSLLALVLLAAGFFFYKNYYIQTIDGLRLQGQKDSLIVYISSKLDESSLSVICVDVYGNQLVTDVSCGKAIFNGLAPNSAYTIKVKMRGIHRLIGHTTDTYTTPSRTEIVQFSAVTGTEDGSVILGFTIDGQDCNQWKVTYSTPGEPTKSTEFSGHMATISGLTVGNEYLFRLEPVTDMYITGANEINYTASTLIRPENLRITGCVKGTLSVAWSAPKNITVPSWTVHCYNDKGYDKTTTTDKTHTEFTDVTDTDSYTVEVTAAGMSVSQRVHMDSNSLTVMNFAVDETDPNSLIVKWEHPAQSEQDSFILQYTVDGSAQQEIICDGNSATISPKVPGSTYAFNLKTSEGKIVLGGSEMFTTAPAPKFDGYGVQYEKLQFMMCRTPAYSDWNRYYLDDSDYTTSFAVNEKASFLVRIRSEYDTSWDEITTLYVIRDADGNIVSTETEVSYWTYMWYRNYGEFDIPILPSIPGDYSISVYFNGSLAGETSFTIYS